MGTQQRRQTSTSANQQDVLSIADYVASVSANMSEKELQHNVIQMAQACGWKVHAERPARTNAGWRTPIQGDAGFPDLILLRGPRALAIELKSEKGVLRPEQIGWLEAFAAAGITAQDWRPSNWFSGGIEEVLR